MPPAFRAAPVRVRVPATSANLGPGFDCAGLAALKRVALEPGTVVVCVLTGHGLKDTDAVGESR